MPRASGNHSFPSSPQSATPVSKDVPIAEHGAIHAPSEPREHPVGPLAFVVDAGSDSVYEFDLGRGRFLGPAPRLIYLNKVITLPGYPTVVGDEPPQTAALSHSALFVAEGSSGFVVRVPITRDGLGTPDRFHLPAVNIPAHDNVPSVSDVYGQTSQPLIKYVVPVTEEEVVAVATAGTGTVLYEVDFGGRRLVATLPIAKSIITSITTDGVHMYAVSNDGTLRVISKDLRVERQASLDSYPNSIVVHRGVAYVAFGSPIEAIRVPAHIDRVDLKTLYSRTVVTTDKTFSGPLAIAGDRLWWVVPGAGLLRWFAMSGSDLVRPGKVATKCKSLQGMAATSDVVLAACVGPGTLIVIDADGGEKQSPREVPGGGFPTDVVLSEG